MICDICKRDVDRSERMILSPVFVSVYNNEGSCGGMDLVTHRIGGIRDVVTCQSCPTGPMLVVNDVITIENRGELVSLQFLQKMEHFCHDCGKSGATRPEDCTPDGVPAWMYYSERAHNYIVRDSNFIHALYNRAMEDPLPSDMYGQFLTQHSIRIKWMNRYITVGSPPSNVFNPLFPDLSTQLSCVQSSTVRGDMAQSVINSCMYLCPDCHTSKGRSQCSDCGAFANRLFHGFCVVCAGHHGYTGEPYPTLLTEINNQHCNNCNRAIPDTFSGSKISYMVGDARVAHKCECDEDYKEIGHCLWCGHREAELAPGLTATCVGCYESASSSRISVDLKENTFGAELEVIGDGDRDYDDYDPDCDCDDCVSRREARESGNHDDAEVVRKAEQIFGGPYTMLRRAIVMPVDDGSLSSGGVEFRVGPLNMKHMDKFLRLVSYLSNAYDVDHSCGGHIHLGAQRLRWYSIVALCKWAKRWEETIFQAVPSHRTRNQYCTPLRDQLNRVIASTTEAQFNASMVHNADKRFLSKSRNKRDPLAVLAYDAGGSLLSRYLWLNVSSYFNHRTIEVRLMEGTLRTARWKSWLTFWDQVITSVGSESEEERNNFVMNSPQQLMLSLNLI